MKFTKEELEYIKAVCSGVKLLEDEWSALFGKTKVQKYRLSIPINKEIAQRKARKATLKARSEELRLTPWDEDDYIACKKEIISIALDRDHYRQMDALKIVLGDKIAIDKAVGSIASSSQENTEKKITLAYNLED